MRTITRLFTRGVIRTYISLQVLILCFGGSASLISGNPPVPVLTLDAGNGITAEFSDYAVTNYEFVDGRYRGTFCFTLTNTSQRPRPALPNFLVGIGLLSDSTTPRFELSPTYVPPGNFFNFWGQTTVNKDTPVDGLLLAGNFMSDMLLDGPTDGIAVGESLSVCMPLTSSSPFTLSDLVARFTVLFSDTVGACFTLKPFQGITTPSSQINVTNFGENEFEFSVANYSTTIIPEIVTGFGFEVPGQSQFSLLSAPTPQPGSQNFLFSTSRRALRLNPRDIRGKLDFGFLTGTSVYDGVTQFGIPILNQSRVFRVGGNFAGLTTRDILTNALVRVPGGWETIADICPTRPHAGTIRGTVATNPR